MKKKGTAFIFTALLAVLFVLSTACPVQPTNQGPQVTAGEDLTAILGTEVTVTAVITDPDTAILDIRWTFQTKPGTSALTDASIGGATTNTATFTPDIVGAYELKIRAFDGEIEGFDYITVNVIEDPAVVADRYVQEGLTFLQSMKYDEALSSFAKAVDADDSSGEAILGYHLLNIGGLITDPAMVTFLTTKVGYTNYPTTMNGLLSVFASFADGNTTTNIWPVISGEDTIDIDNNASTTTPNEKAIAALKFFAYNNTGLEGLPDTMLASMSARIDAAVTDIVNAPSDAKLTISWHAFFPNEGNATASGWPTGQDNKPIDFTFGKPELQVLEAQLRGMRHIVQLMQVYNLTLPLQSYFDSFYTDYLTDQNMTMDNGWPDNPFKSNFFESAADAATVLSSAKTEITAIFTALKSALTAAKDRVYADGYTFAYDSPLLGIQNKSSWDTVVDFEIRIADEVLGSLANNTIAYLPIPTDMNSSEGLDVYAAEKLANWPTSTGGNATSPPTAIGFNYGMFYSNVVFTRSSVIETQRTSSITSDDVGEPVFYTIDNSTGNFVAVTSAPSPDANAYYYIKLPDYTFGGLYDTGIINSIPVDTAEANVTQRFTLEINHDDSPDYNGTWDFNDTNNNGVYDEGNDSYEPLNYVKLRSQASGLIDKANFAQYNNDPAKFYEAEIRNIPTEILAADYNATTQAFVQDVITREANRLNMDKYEYELLVVADKNATALYLGALSPYHVWHSLTAEGTTWSGDINGDGQNETMTSTGTFWWTMLPRVLPDFRN